MRVGPFDLSPTTEYLLTVPSPFISLVLSGHSSCPTVLGQTHDSPPTAIFVISYQPERFQKPVSSHTLLLLRRILRLELASFGIRPLPSGLAAN